MFAQRHLPSDTHTRSSTNAPPLTPVKTAPAPTSVLAPAPAPERADPPVLVSANRLAPGAPSGASGSSPGGVHKRKLCTDFSHPTTQLQQKRSCQHAVERGARKQHALHSAQQESLRLRQAMRHAQTVTARALRDSAKALSSIQTFIDQTDQMSRKEKHEIMTKFEIFCASRRAATSALRDSEGHS